MPDVEAQLRSGAVELGVELSDAAIHCLLQYAALLRKWGQVYNLTARLSDQEIVSHHLLDSLAIVPALARAGVPGRILDVGSGAGLPGVVLAVAFPQTKVDCVDAVAKKAAFIQHVAGALALSNLRGICSRVEVLPDKYPLVTSRAFAALPDFVGITERVLEPAGIWLAMKGKFPTAEVAALPTGVDVFHVEQLHVPGLRAERCLVWLRRGPALT